MSLLRRNEFVRLQTGDASRGKASKFPFLNEEELVC
jgi:hypothetical protein